MVGGRPLIVATVEFIAEHMNFRPGVWILDRGHLDPARTAIVVPKQNLNQILSCGGVHLEGERNRPFRNRSSSLPRRFPTSDTSSSRSNAPEIGGVNADDNCCHNR